MLQSKNCTESQAIECRYKALPSAHKKYARELCIYEMVSFSRSILCINVVINRVTYRCSMKMKSPRRVLLTLQMNLLYRQTYLTGITFIK